MIRVLAENQGFRREQYRLRIVVNYHTIRRNGNRYLTAVIAEPEIADGAVYRGLNGDSYRFLARAVAVGFPHHITHRGNNRQDIFFVNDDRRAYLEILKQHCDKYGLDVHAYCLMTNHIHIVAVPNKDDSLAKAVGRAHLRYTQYINRMHRRSGHLWEGRFYSCALDEKGFWLAAKYVELNPVRAKVCRVPWQYEWSSIAAHLDKSTRDELLNLSSWHKMISSKEWRSELASGIDEAQMARIRLSTHTGRPLATDSFISKLEKMLGRRVRPLPIGRPRKKTAKS